MVSNNIFLERLAEAAVLTGVTWPLVRICATRQFWHTFPHIAKTAAGLLVAYILIIICIAIFLPLLLLPFAVLAGGVLICIFWCMRPGFGRRRGWPPGSLTLLTPAPWFNEQFFHEQAARYGPVFKTSYFLRPMVCIVGLEIGLDLLRRYDESLGTPPLPFSRFIPGGYLRYLDPAVHKDYKAIFRDTFSSGVVRNCERFLINDFKYGLSCMAVESTQNAATGIKPKPHLNRMLFSSWIRLFLGINSDSEEYAELRNHFHTIDMRNPSGASDKTIEQALESISAILYGQLHQFAHLEKQHQAIPRCFLAELSQSHPNAVHDPTVLRNLIYFLHVTWSDVAALLLWLLKMLCDHPEWATRLRNSITDLDCSEASASDLGTRVVAETLRLEQSEHLYRTALMDINFNEFVIPKGWMIRICVRESHQNADAFTEPQRFNPDRFLDHTYKLSEYCPFGAYRLACLGQFLTKFVGRIFVNEIAAKYDLQGTDDGPREFSEWRHWRPNSEFRLLVTERT